MKAFLLLILVAFFTTSGVSHQAFGSSEEQKSSTSSLIKILNFLKINTRPLGSSLVPNRETNRAISSTKETKKKISGIVDSQEDIEIEVLPVETNGASSLR